MTRRGRAAWQEYLGAVALVGLTTVGCLALRRHLQTTDVAMLYLLAIVVVASRYPRAAALLATLLSVAAFDFLFVPPYNTFDVHSTAYFLTFGVMLAVALMMSRLTARIRDQAAEARERERRTRALYELSRELSETEGRQEQLAVATRHLGHAAGGAAELFLLDEGGSMADEVDWPTRGAFESVETSVAARWAYERGEAAGMGTRHCVEAEALVLPLKTPVRRLGVAIVSPPPDQVIEPPDALTAAVLADQVAATLEQTIWAERHEQARVEIESERLRTALLSSLSHDLRTPLGSIEGAASSLLHDADALPVDVRRDLAVSILEESRRMTRLVANLLDMVRLETGGLAVQKSWQPLEEPLGVALLRLDSQLRDHPVHTRLPDDLPMVPIDELLVEQVFINLLENAVKYSPPGTPITVSASLADGAVEVEVADRGQGVPKDEEDLVFRKFYRVPSAEPAAGAGLGLAICRGIVSAHGGRIWVERPPEGGAAFRFTLPLKGPPIPAPPADIAASP